MCLNSTINPLVSIACITYNQESYIRQCIEGFLMQKTNFPFEILIHDDASTDDTVKIIKEYEAKYSNIIKPIYQSENQYKKGNGILAPFVYPRCSGKYIALCEGDDYWIDPFKLQKQVDFMEANEEFGLIYTDASIYYQERNIIKKTISSTLKEKPYSGDIFHRLLAKNTITTLTVLARKKCILEAVEHLGNSIHKFKMGDYPMWLEISRNNKIKYIDDVTAVYRVSSNSASNYFDIKKRYEFLQSAFDIRFCFCEMYGLTDVQQKIQNDYNRFECLRAFDLKLDVEKEIVRLFVPISIYEKIVKYSFSSNFANLLVRTFFGTISILKKLK